MLIHRDMTWLLVALLVVFVATAVWQLGRWLFGF